jgi:hypothetical protein
MFVLEGASPAPPMSARGPTGARSSRKHRSVVVRSSPEPEFGRGSHRNNFATAVHRRAEQDEADRRRRGRLKQGLGRRDIAAGNKAADRRIGADVRQPAANFPMRRDPVRQRRAAIGQSLSPLAPACAERSRVKPAAPILLRQSLELAQACRRVMVRSPARPRPWAYAPPPEPEFQMATLPKMSGPFSQRGIRAMKALDPSRKA